MNVKRLCGYCLVLTLGLFSSACFSFEQEVFLNADGSGELFLYISMPDLPDEMMKSASDPGKKSPADEMAEFKKEMLSGASGTLKLKEAKEIRQNGARGMLAVFQFKDLRDIAAAMASLGKGTMKEGEFKGKNQWSVELQKVGGKNLFTGKFLLELEEKKEEKPKPAAGKEEPAFDMKGLEEQMMPLLLGMIKMRFTLHTPTPITESNADMVLRGNTAVWNCSMAAFVKNKKPIEMKATY
jgi:hypothetical protein